MKTDILSWYAFFFARSIVPSALTIAVVLLSSILSIGFLPNNAHHAAGIISEIEVSPPREQYYDALAVLLLPQEKYLVWGGRKGLVLYNLEDRQADIVNIAQFSPAKRIYSLNVDSSHCQLYIGTNDGLFLYSLLSKQLTSFFISTDRRARIINAIVSVSDDDLVLGTDHGLFLKEGDTIRPLYDSHEFGVRRVLDMAYSDSTGLWIAKENVLSRYYEGSWSIYLREMTNPDRSVGLISNNITAVATSADRTLWVGTTLGLNSFNGEGWEVFTQRDALFRDCQGLASDYIYGLAIDSRQRIWVCYGILGLGVSMKEGDCWKTITVKDGLVSGYVYSMVPDREKGMWFGSDRGVQYFYENEWENFQVICDEYHLN